MDAETPRHSIYIVEDDPVIVRVLRARLAKLGYDVCGSAADGATALEQMKQINPDLAILDIGIRGEMDGIGLAHLLSVETDIPFIFLTARDDDASLEQIKQTIPYGFVRKPFDDNQLRIAIKLALP